MIEKGKDLKSISEIVQNGKKFKVTVTTGSKVLTNEFTIGEEAELETPTGEKVKVGAWSSLRVGLWVAEHLLWGAEHPESAQSLGRGLPHLAGSCPDAASQLHYPTETTELTLPPVHGS